MFDRLRSLLPARLAGGGPVIPVVRIAGVIGLLTPLRPGVTLASIAPALDKAFAFSRAPAVAIIVNSPGGSPVQAHLIHRRIRALAEEKGKRVLVFVEDAAASGGYMIACAGDEVVADPSSIVGSIGVVSQGFGFVGLIDKLGVERRVHTAGDRKAILDPFRPERPEDVDHLLRLQEEVHDGFVDLVRERRAGLLADDPELFSGLFWTGRTALGLGLVDSLGDLRGTLRARFGPDAKARPVGGERAMPWRRGSGVEGRLAEEIIAAVEARALWARYGL
jgi:signal peptide peptidase SppA